MLDSARRKYVKASHMVFIDTIHHVMSPLYSVLHELRRFLEKERQLVDAFDLGGN